MSFERGDLVCVIRAGHICYGKCGNIKDIRSSKSDIENIGIEFADVFPGLHDMSGHSPTNRGYYVSKGEIVKMYPMSEVIKSFTAKEQAKKQKTKTHETLILIEE
jgi:hypothetical protein